MNIKKLLLLVIIIIIFFAGTTAIIFTQYKIKASIVIPMKIIASNQLGFNTDTEILHFGEARPGDTGIRTIEIKNTNDLPVTAYFFTHGEMKNWVQKEPIYLNTQESKNITISAKIPENTEYGEYTGVLQIVFKKT